MSNTSVSLKTLHFLLQHMEANKRFEICQRCPALREFEKSVPLKIKSLVLKESYVAVNDTTYKLGIIRKCKVGEAPRYVTYANEMGCVWD
ncbi:CBN-FBXC-17 protein [Caenorhabditis brenneri]|uniref:CBN-FBXC-17 protein n=1 Tax=Caenorhabditis brenneri TaxID=135651 RepID=G0NXC5_CAEBE|nr:CBN-FBXC-17 protein [Caenorhabditis brenneri]